MDDGTIKPKYCPETRHLSYYVISIFVLCALTFFFVVDQEFMQQTFYNKWKTFANTSMVASSVDESEHARIINASGGPAVEHTSYATLSHNATGRSNANASNLPGHRSVLDRVDVDQYAYYEALRRHGMDSTALHDFKSPYIVDPGIYRDTDFPVLKAPGKRKTKIVSCFNCAKWFVSERGLNSHNRDFTNCPYSECFFDRDGKRLDDADVVLFFPGPKRLPPRPVGQIWAYCSWESPVHYGYPSPYSRWKNVFNWTVTYRINSDLFFPNNRLVWMDSNALLPDAEYQQRAKGKTKTAAWFVSNCGTQSKRETYVKEMKKYIDIDVYGRCGSMGNCDKTTCLKKLNDTYKFYLAFENSICRDYVTEKLFRNFEDRIHVIPVVRGGLDYEKYMPPNTVIDANNFKGAKELALYLKDLGKDINAYSKMLKDKDRLRTLDYKHDWCETCEKLHTDTRPKMIEDIKKYMQENACWNWK